MSTPVMVALKTPTSAELYRAVCAFLQKNQKSSVIVTNHIAAKHRIHSLPAFHTSSAVSEEARLETYGEIAKALSSDDYSQLKGQVANGQAADPAAETPRVEPKARVTLPEPTPVARVATPPAPAPERRSDPLTEQLRSILRELLGEMPGTLDEDKVAKIVAAQLAEIPAPELPELPDVTKLVADAVKAAIAALPKPEAQVHRIEFKVGDAVRPVEGIVHRQLPQVLAWLNAGVPVWLWGQAGGGKTTLGRQVASALGVKPYIVSIDETITVGKLVGFRNVSNGEFVEGLVYRAYKEGGVLMLDEIDTNASCIAALNSMLANNHYTFPNGEEVERHPKFRVLAGANTKGTGAVAGYTARVRMDAATLDRFAVIKLEYDADLELALSCGVPMPAPTWMPQPSSSVAARAYVDWVQRCRSKCGDSVLISPRASLLGVQALRAGVPMMEVAEALVFKLVTPDTKARLLAEAGAVPFRV